MPGPKWASCANCGRSYPGMTSDTCSAQCTAQLNAKRALKQPHKTPPETFRKSPDRRAKPTKPGPAKAKKGCDLVLLPPVVAGIAAFLMIRRNRR